MNQTLRSKIFPIQGLPLSTVRVLRPESDKEEMVEAIFQEDKAAGRLPILCIANVHSSLFQCSSPSNFENLCRRNNVWLHLEGHALAALALLNSETKNPPTADSLSLTLGSWIGVPAVPFVTMYKVSIVCLLNNRCATVINLNFD